MWKSLNHILLICCLFFVAGATYAANLTRLNAAEKVWLDAHQVLRVGVVESTAPILFYSGRNQAKGLVNDYLHALALHLGLQLEIRRFADESSLANALTNSEIDLIGAVPYGVDAAKPWLYTRPYLSLPVALYGTDSLSISGIPELRGKSVAVVKDTIWGDSLHSLMPGVKVISFSTIEDALSAVANSRATAFLGDVATTESVLDQAEIGGIAERYRTQLTYDIAAATPQDVPELQSLIQKGLERITDDELNSIWLRWPNVERPGNIDTSFPVWALLLPLFVMWTLFVGWAVRRYTKQEQVHLHGRMKAKIASLRQREKVLKTKMLRLKQKALSYRSELRKHRQQVVLMRDVMPSAAWEWDASTGQCQWDAGMYDFFQADKESFEPTPEAILNLVHEDDRAKVSVLFSSEPENGEVQMSYRVVLPDGRTRWMLDYSHGSEEEEGSQRVGICWDVSDYQEMVGDSPRS